MVVEAFMARDCMRQNRLMISAAAAHFWESSQFSKMDEIYFLITLMHAWSPTTEFSRRKIHKFSLCVEFGFWVDGRVEIFADIRSTALSPAAGVSAHSAWIFDLINSNVHVSLREKRS